MFSRGLDRALPLDQMAGASTPAQAFAFAAMRQLAEEHKPLRRMVRAGQQRVDREQSQYRSTMEHADGAKRPHTLRFLCLGLALVGAGGFLFLHAASLRRYGVVLLLVGTCTVVLAPVVQNKRKARAHRHLVEQSLRLKEAVDEVEQDLLDRGILPFLDSLLRAEVVQSQVGRAGSSPLEPTVLRYGVRRAIKDARGGILLSAFFGAFVALSWTRHWGDPVAVDVVIAAYAAIVGVTSVLRAGRGMFRGPVLVID